MILHLARHILANSTRRIPANLSRPIRHNHPSFSNAPATFPLSKSHAKVCDNPESVARACKTLNEASYIFIDCEGHNVKKSDGSGTLSLIQMGTPHAEHVFIFDMFTLERNSEAIGNVLSIISSPRILKIGWGGTEDFSSLLLIYKRQIRPFLDLQLADIHSRLRRKEPYAMHISRLASAAFPVSAIRHLQIEGVHRLSRMDDALHEHNICEVSLKENHKGRWYTRPLPPSDIRYASNDIIRISKLHDYFRNSGNLSIKLLTDTIVQTEIYMELHNPSSVYYARKPFFPLNILPLDIINISAEDSAFFTRNKDLRKCKQCLRALTIGSFPFNGSEKDEEGKFMGDIIFERHDICKVCMFFIKKELHIVHEATGKAMKFLKKFSRNSGISMS